MKDIRKYSVDLVILIVIVFLFISTEVAVINNNLERFIAPISLLLSYLFAKHFGDVAGQKAARAYAEEETMKARIIAIKSLLNEAQRARDLAKKNSELVVADSVYNTRGAVRMPVSAFETALVSRESTLLDEARDAPDLDELLAAIREYLTEAYAINALIEVRLAAIISYGTGLEQRTDATREIKAKSDGLPETLDRLKKCLRHALEKAHLKLDGLAAR